MKTHPTTNSPDPEWLTIEDLSVTLHQSVHTIYKWSRRGWPDFPHCVRLPNGRILVSRGALGEWLEGRAA